MARSTTSALYNQINANSSPVASEDKRRTPGSSNKVGGGNKTPKTPTTPTVLNTTTTSTSNFTSSPITPSPLRRPRKLWTDAEEACLISGVAKHSENNWENILNDPEYSFNERTVADLKMKYKSLVKGSLNNQPEEIIFDIRTANSLVTEVFIGPDWSRSEWKKSETILPVERFEVLLSEFEKKIKAKQLLISRISPSRVGVNTSTPLCTPSRFISNLNLNSTVGKRRRKSTGVSSDNSENEDSNNQTSSSPLTGKSHVGNTPLKRVHVMETSKSKSSEAILLHSETEEGDVEEVVYPNEDDEEINEVDIEAKEPTQQTQASMKSRCIIM